MKNEKIRFSIVIVYIIFTFSILLYLSANRVNCLEDETTEQQVQTTTYAYVTEGNIYCLCNVSDNTKVFYNFGTVEHFNYPNLEDGTYIIFWNGNVLEDEQNIKAVYSLNSFEFVHQEDIDF